MKALGRNKLHNMKRDENIKKYYCGDYSESGVYCDVVMNLDELNILPKMVRLKVSRAGFEPGT